MSLPKSQKNESSGTATPAPKSAVGPKKTPPRERTRLEICNDGDTGPYILCDPEDLTALRVFLREKHKLEISFVPDVISDSQSGKSLAGMANIADLPPGFDLEELQKELDEKFPTEAF